MSQVELMLVAVSMLFSFAFLKAMDALNAMFEQPNRAELVPALWLLNRLFGGVLILWAYVLVLETFTAHFSVFMLRLLIPGLAYLQVLSLVSSRPEEVEDWGARYAKARVRFLSLGIAITAVIALTTVVEEGDAVPLAPFLLQVAIQAVGLASPRAGVQLVTVIGHTLVLVLGILRLMVGAAPV